MSDFECRTCGEAWNGAYNCDHRCTTCGDPIYALDCETKLARVKRELADMTDRAERLYEEAKTLGIIVHDMVTAEQAAWIEWQHGRGADAAMTWIHNGLCGPGHIPDEDAPWGKDPQAWYDANKAHPFPACHCGRPSNQLWMGHGACCDEHMQEVVRQAEVQ